MSVQTIRLDGFSFNRRNLVGVDSDALAGITRLLNQREREINTIQVQSYVCAGGPFHGQTIELALDADIPRTAEMTVGKWSGRYQVVHHSDSEAVAAVWFGNDSPTEVEYYFRTPTAKPAPKSAPVKGFSQLADLFASEPEVHMMPMLVRRGSTTIFDYSDHAAVECAVFTIGRTMFRCLNTPEAIAALHAKILKAKKWFSDKVLP